MEKGIISLMLAPGFRMVSIFARVNKIWRLRRLNRLRTIGGMASPAEEEDFIKMEGNKTTNSPQVMSRKHTVRLILKLIATYFISPRS